MKKEVEKFIRENGCSVSYSGKNKEMYISGTNARSVKTKALKRFPDLEFDLTGARNF